MDPALYRAAVEGVAEDSIFRLKASEFSCNVTPKGNTVLHVAACHGHADQVRKILSLIDALSMELLRARNRRNETALHLAASKGHVGVVSALIDGAKSCPTQVQLEQQVSGAAEMLRMTNCDDDTALHMAARRGHYDVVKLLANEDVEFKFSPNKMDETPIYLAAESGFLDCLSEMLNSSIAPTFAGPFGRTALHAAVIHESTGCTKALLAKEKPLCEAVDRNGWTALHYAAKFCDNEEIANEILGVNSSLTYFPARRDDGWTTAFHIAASEGHIKVMETILRHCPDAWEMLDSKGRNVLHEAIVNERTNVINHIVLKHHCIFENNLVHEKDNDGNTPQHMYAASKLLVPLLSGHAMQFRKQFTMDFNKHHSSPSDIFYSFRSVFLKAERIYDVMVARNGGRRGENLTKGKWNFTAESTREERKKALEKSINKPIIEEKGVRLCMKETAKTEILVATLITTVTFAAVFSVPGGYDGISGMPVLMGKPAFWGFVVADTIAFVCSVAAIEAYTALMGEVEFNVPDTIYINHFIYASIMLHLSAAAVFLAFVTGLYAVLVHQQTAASVVVGVIIFVFLFGIVALPVVWRQFVTFGFNHVFVRGFSISKILAFLFPPCLYFREMVE